MCRFPPALIPTRDRLLLIIHPSSIHLLPVSLLTAVPLMETRRWHLQERDQICCVFDPHIKEVHKRRRNSIQKTFREKFPRLFYAQHLSEVTTKSLQIFILQKTFYLTPPGVSESLCSSPQGSFFSLTTAEIRGS